MKILITTGIYPPDIGGPATYSKLLHEELPKRGIEAKMLSFGTVRHLPKIIRHIVFGIKIIHMARGVDVIFAQDTVSVGLPSLYVSKLLKKKFFVRVPGDYAWEQSVQRYDVKDTIDDFQKKTYDARVENLRSIQKHVVNGAHTVITPSMYFKDLVSKWVSDPEKVKCIYNGIDLNELIPSTNYEPKTIFSAGRLVPWKGFEKLIESLRSLPDWKLYIAGDGPIRKELEEKATNTGVSNRVFFLGQISRPELIKRMTSCDVFVLNTHFESFSFQVVEAMAGGVPVITTNVGNLAEIVDQDKSGYLIRPDDIEQIVQKCLELSTNIELRKRIIEEAKRKAAQFSIERTVDNVASMLV